MEVWQSLWEAQLGDAVVFGVRFGGHLIVEVVLAVVIVFLLFQKSYQPASRPLSEKEIDQLVEEWTPEPLHPPVTKEMTPPYPVLESAAGPTVQINGRKVINLSTANYLGFVGDERIKESCNATLLKYGVGACGPRGFYGTIDVHLDLETKISSFLGTSESILYSYGLATAASCIPAFCKRGDIIIADDGVSWGIQNGLHLSRSTIKYFRHNDMGSLETRLKEVRKEDERKKKPLNRRFIVVEAIYQNSGKVAPLGEIVRLKEKYLFRLLVDESNSIGVLGKSGRGISEHFNIPIEKIDIITAAMGTAFASAGGFCTGSAKVVDHQRLSGAGYCFSASLPPFLATASISAIELLEDDPSVLARLHNNIALFHKCLSDVSGIRIGSDTRSPVVLLHLRPSLGSFHADAAYLQAIVDEMLEHSVLMSVQKRTALDNCALPAGIRVCISAGHTESDIISATAVLKKVMTSKKQ
ncbi:hypothetical protein SELMODRAFT_230105 [Selaginella moellendorffii]|uniref:serine C-palmitoyltransferase n=1 Tax=Selaginella moellendorffii TaxID=88036 RepID=D8QUP1_SELML|nr:long chain base biosynthesis protein 1b [Selaginella moellendorffii]EFJ35907.1 hypothetical protein SELMODRAFT_230105 [Selaginella moellendorffii]|eukprot:XP_002962444.1 long chain base biosynthesis protein 1b [Selaginella moellendorffii]